jgi:hypothetical protein
MKQAAKPSLSFLLISSAIALSLYGCKVNPSAQKPVISPSYRYNAHAESPAFIGSHGYQLGQLDSLLQNSQRADALTLFVGANTALKQGRLVEAGLLYQQAQIRRLTDLQRYPVIPTAQAELKTVNRLKATVSAGLGPKLLDKPKLYGQIAQRLERWRCDTAPGYKPSWQYIKLVPSVTCTSFHQQKIRLMRDLSVLMQQEEYASAAQLAEYYQNSSSSVRELAGLKEGYLRALATMRAIERKQKRVGLSTRF